MRRSVIIGLLAAAALATGAIYWFANRTMVVGRANIGPPPPPPTPHVSMIGTHPPVFENLRGRVVLVTIWATWCHPCTRELPRIEREVWQRFRPNIEVIGVAEGQEARRVQDFNQRAGLTFQLLPDPDREISNRLGGDRLIPHTFLLDRSGTVVYEAVGYNEQHFDRIVSAVERAIKP